MTTSLSRQLQKLQVPQTKLLDIQQSRGSILFPRGYAKTFSKNDCYKIGYSGFKELLKVNGDFDKFEDTLFAPKTVNDLPRGNRDSDFNKKLDKVIKEFLFLLSPYLEKNDALKALEWLLYRFSVNSMNLDAFLTCALPYYESVLFTRILQVADLKVGKNALTWKWLLKAQKGGAPLAKQVVYAHWAADQGFRTLIKDYIRDMVKIHNNKQNVKIAISFFITTQMGGLNIVSHVKEEHLFSISASIQWCLHSNISELVAGTYFMIIHMCLKTKLSDSLIDAILIAMFKNVLPDLTEQFSLCLLTICNHQNITKFSDKLIQHMSNNAVLQYISSVALEKSVASFLTPYVYGKVKFIFSEEMSIDARIDEFNSLFKYVLEMNITPIEAALVIRSFITALQKYMNDREDIAHICNIENIIEEFERNHPEGTDRAAVKLFLANSDIKILNHFNEKQLDFLNIEEASILKGVVKSMTDSEELSRLTNKENFHFECIKLLKKCLEKEKCDSDWRDVRHEVVKLIIVKSALKLNGDEKLGLFLLLIKNFSISQTGLDLLEFWLVLQSELGRTIPLSCILRLTFSEKLKNELNVSPKDVLSSFWSCLPSALSELDLQCNESILTKIEKMNFDLSENQIFLLHFLHAYMSMEGESFLRHRVSNSLLDATSAILQNKKSKIKEGDKKQEKRSNSVPIELLLRTYEIVLIDLEGILDQALPRNKSFFIISEGKQDDFNSGARMLVKVLKDILIMESRGIKSTDVVIRDVFKRVLCSPSNALRFLSMIWSWHPELHSEGITIPLKLWALNLATSLLDSNKIPDAILKLLLNCRHSFISSLFLPLCEGDEELCKAALCLLEKLAMTRVGRENSSDTFLPLIRCILKFRNEIRDDYSYLPTAVKNADKDTVKKLLTLVVEDLIPSHTKCSVLYMCSSVEGAFIINELLPMGNSLLERIKELPLDGTLDPISSLNLYYILSRFASSGTTFQMKEGWELYQTCINYPKEVMRVTGNHFSPRDLVVNFNVLKHMEFKTDRQLELFDVLLTKAVQSQTTNDALKLRKELKKITVDASKLVVLLQNFKLTSNVRSVKEARAKRLATMVNNSSHADNEVALNWQKFGLLVELIGVMNNVHQPWLLVGPLCNYLSQSFQLDMAVMDVTQQNILSLLLHILQTSAESLKGDFAKHVQLDVVLIVRCIRTSTNPDIHRRALLILSVSTPYYPTQVLHSIMAIFTFMGSSLVRRDDAYSFQVIHSTISSIIPTLIKTDRSNPASLLRKLAEVSQVFVDALPDIAAHRRLPLFTQLAKTMGVTEYLWLVMVLIADSYIMKPANDGHTQATLPSTIQFALMLYSQFSVIEQLEATSEVANFLFALPKEKEKSTFKKSSSVQIINLDIHSEKQLRHLKYTCLGLVVRLLTSELFIGQVYEITSENVDKCEIEKLKTLYTNLLQKGLGEIKTMSVDSGSNKDLTSHFEVAMKKKLVSFVDAINALLPPSLLIDVVTNLLQSDVALLRCRAMEILAQKLHTDIKFFDEKHYDSVINFSSFLNVACANMKDPEVNQQTALYTLQLLVRTLGTHMKREVIEGIVQTQCKIIVRPNISAPLKAQAILVSAETVTILKASILPYLKNILPLLIQILEEGQNEHLLLAGSTALNKLVDVVPQFVHKYISKIIVSSCCLLAQLKKESAEKESASVENRIYSKLSGIHHCITEKVEPRIAVPAFSDAYKEINKKNSMASLPALLQLIESFISDIKSEQLLAYKQDFIKLFTRTLDVRIAPVEAHDMEMMEDCVISALSRFLLKLNEDDNLSIYINLITWSKDENYPNRLITFFKFSDKLASVLKVLFIKTKLADKLLSYAVDTLGNKSSSLGKLFSQEKESDVKVNKLLVYIYDSLTKIFTYDSVQFMNEDRFNLVLEPLIDQIENDEGGEDNYAPRIREHLRPCIVSFTKALTDDSLWKALNKAILMKLRNDDDPKITLGCLEVFEGLVESLGEDYLQPLLGDTMPYITEVVESLDNDVQNRTREIFSKMEGILGDDLRAYLN